MISHLLEVSGKHTHRHVLMKYDRYYQHDNRIPNLKKNYTNETTMFRDKQLIF